METGFYRTRVTANDLEHLIPSLPLNVVITSLCLSVYATLKAEPWTSWLLGKHSTIWASSSYILNPFYQSQFFKFHLTSNLFFMFRHHPMTASCLAVGCGLGQDRTWRWGRLLWLPGHCDITLSLHCPCNSLSCRHSIERTRELYKLREGLEPDEAEIEDTVLLFNCLDPVEFGGGQRRDPLFSIWLEHQLTPSKTSMVGYVCSPIIQEAKPFEFGASLGYIVRSCLINTGKQKSQ